MAEGKPNILDEMKNKKSKLEAQLEKLEKFIYDKETKYLENTISTGNILKGWEHFFTSKTKLPSRALQPGKRLRISNAERLFSQTSFNNMFLREDNALSNQQNEKTPSLWTNSNNNNILIPKNLNTHRRKKKISQSLSFKKKKNHLSSMKESQISNQTNHLNGMNNELSLANDGYN